VRSIGGQGGGEGRLKRPRSVAIGTEGGVIVSDFGLKTVLVFSKEGKYLQSVGQGASAVESLKNPRGVAVDEDGVLYVVDTGASNAPPGGPDRGIRMYTSA
jgi:DNA-binding beta-propeller fold protein YncE